MRNFSELKYLIKQRKWIFLTPILLCPFLALMLVMVSEPIFVSEVKVWTKEKQDESMLLKVLRQGIQEETYIKVQAQIILSKTTLKRVVEELNLDVPPPSQSIFRRLTGWKKHYETPETHEEAVNGAVESLLKSISVEILNPEVMQITVKSNSPTLSRAIANSLIVNYKQVYLNILNKEVEAYENFLDKWLDELKNDIQSRLAALSQFEKEHPEMQQELIVPYEINKLNKKEILSPTFAKNMADASPIPNIMNRIGSLKLDLNKLQSVSTKNSFEIEKLVKEIAKDELLLDIYSQYLSEQAVLYIKREQLNWDLTEAQRRYTSTLNEYDKIHISRGSKLQQTTSITILDEPSMSLKPIFPRKKITLFVSMMLGLFISSIILYIRILFDKKIYFPKDIHEVANLNVMSIYKVKNNNAAKASQPQSTP